MGVRFNKFLGIDTLPEIVQNVVLKFFYIQGLIVLFSGMGQTFIILDYIDEFGFAIAGFLMATMFFSQLVSDYPTGSLGDYIGQRIVIALGLIFLAIGFLLIGLFSGYTIYFIAAIVFGLGLGQMSGAMETWLDNNYKIASKETDVDKKIYGFAMHRLGTILSFLMAISFVVGGAISTYFGRKVVFTVVSILLILLTIIVVIYVDNVKEEELVQESQKEENGYLFYLKGGIGFLFSSRIAFFLLFGLALIDLSLSIWFVLILFPVYFAYTGTDAGVGLIRSAIFIIGGFRDVYTAKWNKKLSNKALAPIIFGHVVLFYLGVIFILHFIPPENSFNLLGIVALVVFFFVVNSFAAIGSALRQRVLLEKIPSENRNSIYSLLPTISLVLQVPLLIVTGKVIENGSLSSGIVVSLSIATIGGICLLLFQRFDTDPLITEVKQETKIGEIAPS